MERTPPIPKELWEQIPLPVQVVLWEVFDRYDARIARLEAEVAELKVQRHQNSQNSSKPPSSNGPHVKRKPPRPSHPQVGDGVANLVTPRITAR